jgi:LmbE family N-acetylglucosaminyl deacetylase
MTLEQRLRTVLFVGAHPDDETMLAGGTLALLSSQGVAVHILCATRGEGGEMGVPPVCTRVELGAVREGELRCAAQQLGAASVQVLGYVDPLIGPDEALYPFEADPVILAKQIVAAIDSVEAEVVLSHGSDGEYGHPGHQFLHRAVRRAVESSNRQVVFYSFAANVPGIEDHIWNASEHAHLALDVRPWLDRKESAALCHKTQHALFQRGGARTIRAALRPVESFHRQTPPADGRLQDPFARFLRAAGAWEPPES